MNGRKMMKTKKRKKKVTERKFPLRKEFAECLIDLVSKSVGCSIQYNGCPCNTCFHTWVEDELGMSSDMAHLFWIVVLSLRGDYKEEELFRSNVENFVEIIKRWENK
jgi:hypothetical protein